MTEKKLGIFARLFKPDSSLPRHLTGSIALEEAELPNLLRLSVILIGGILSVFLAWATFTCVEEVASASGQVIPSNYVQVAQHLEGGIVKEILVKEGDLVEAGQPLIRLDNISAKADLGQMQARQQALQLQVSRLKSFTGGNFSEEQSEDEKSLTPEEKQILASMENARETQRNVLIDQAQQKEKELKALSETRMALEKNVSLMEKESQIRDTLADKGFGSRIQALSSERELNQMKGQLEETKDQEARAEAAISEAEGRLKSLDADLKQQAMKNLGEVEAQLAEVTQNLEKLEHTADLMLITAPVRGIVKGLSVHTIGAVVEQGKSLLEVVPVDVELMVEALVQPSDVGHLKPGQPVKVKVSAFDSSRYGSIPGHLLSVSATTFQGQDGKSFYKAQIKMDHNYVGKDPTQNLILPGMTVTADIITGDKTVLQYLLKPIHVAAESAFHER